jgi:hypothetical protein
MAQSTDNNIGHSAGLSVFRKVPFPKEVVIQFSDRIFEPGQSGKGWKAAANEKDCMAFNLLSIHGES